MDEIEIIFDQTNKDDHGQESKIDRPEPPRRTLSSPRKHRLNKSILVTDVSSGFFRYVYATRQKGILTVIDFGELSPEGLGVESQDPLDLHRAGMAWIEGNTSFKVKDILVVSSELDFFIRKLVFPLGRRGEAERAARWEIEKQIPIRSADSYLRIRKDEFRDDFCRLTVGAVPKNQVNSWQFLDKRLIGVVPTAVALTAVGPEALSQDISYCYIYREESSLCIGFYNSDGLQYSHPVITNPAYSGYGFPDNSINSAKIVDEFSSSMEVFYSRFPEMRVAGIVLFISPEEISQIAPILRENVVIDVIPVDFPENINADFGVEGKKPGIKYFPLLGAAQLKTNDFHFLPKSLEDNIKNRMARKILAYGFSATLALLILLSAYWIAEGKILSARLDALKAQKENIEKSPAFIISREYSARTKILRTLDRRFSSKNEIFSHIHIALGELAPERVFINSLILNRDKEPGQVEISGYFDGDLSKSDVAILNFMDNLEGFGLRNIKLKRLGSKLSGGEKIESFSITGELSP
jgi:hypothetical protein